MTLVSDSMDPVDCGCLDPRDSAQRIPSPKRHVIWGQPVHSQPFRKHGSGDLPLHKWSQVLSPTYDMDACMATLFGGEACSSLVWRFWSSIKVTNSDPTLNITCLKTYSHGIITQGRLPLMGLNYTSMVSSSWKVGTLPPCWDLGGVHSLLWFAYTRVSGPFYCRGRGVFTLQKGL